MPPAFVLSQDQTLRKIKILSEISDLAYLFDYCKTSVLSKSFSGLHRTIQFSINSQPARSASFIIYHAFSNLSSRSFKIFKTLFQPPTCKPDSEKYFKISAEAISNFFHQQRPSRKRRNRVLKYHQFQVLQIKNKTFFKIIHRA